MWKEIVVYGSPGAVVQIPDEFTHEVSDGLDNYPPLDTVTIPDQDKASWTWQAGTGAPAPALAAPTISAGSTTVALPTAAPPQTTGGGFSLDWRLAAVVGGCICGAVVGQVLWHWRRGRASDA